MILYNVTINVDDDVHDEWLDWMKSTHLPMVMDTGKFISFEMYRILSRQEDEEGVTYSVQYKAESLKDYEEYRDNFGPGLQEETSKRYGGKYVAFRTILELEHQYE